MTGDDDFRERDVSQPFPRRCQPSLQRGFSLVELILVMVIAGVLAAVAVPRLVGRNSFDSRGFSDQLTATVRFAQKLAIAQRRDVVVRFTPGDATLCYNTVGACVPAPGPGGEKPYAVAAPGGVTIASPVASLVFDAIGRPVGMAAALDIQVNGSGAYHVWVEQETGYVHD